MTEFKDKVSKLRKSYTAAGLERDSLYEDPLEQFALWFEQAVAVNREGESNAMTLATASEDGIPSARTVLLKGFDERGFVFYTNYESQKGRELLLNPHAALVFYWGVLERQVRVTGPVSQVSREETAAYFHTRPHGSQLSAWASPQSQIINNREVLEVRLAKLHEKYADKEIPPPPFWGGFRLRLQTIEFWQGRPNRLHDRFRFTRQVEDDSWQIDRLSP